MEDPSSKKKERGFDARAGRKRYFNKRQTEHHLRLLRKRLQAPLAQIASKSGQQSSNTLFLSLMETNPLGFSEISNALFAEECQPWEREMALAMFRVWLAAPSDYELQLRALRSFVRSYAEKLEKTCRSLDLWSQGINALSARLNDRNAHFYTGIYQDIGGLPAVSVADSPGKIDGAIRSSAVWMFEALVMFDALHILKAKGGVEKPLTYRKAKKLVDEHSWRPKSSCFDRPRSRRKVKTIENNFRRSTLAPMIVYAAYLTETPQDGNLLDAIVGGTVSYDDLRPYLCECLGKAKTVCEEFTPDTLLKNAGKTVGLPTKGLPLPPPEGFSDDVANALRSHLGPAPGRPKSASR